MRSGFGLMIIGALILGACSGGFDSAPYTDAVADRFDDGVLMDTEQARCVADDVAQYIDWAAAEAGGLIPSDLFGDVALSDQLSGSDIDALILAIDGCRGAEEIVLSIFADQGSMGEAQLSCFASRMTPAAARSLLRLIIADDLATFTGSEGEVLLGICGQGVSG